MPLSHVLDVETGIGYPQNSGDGDINPLIDDLFIPGSQNTFKEREVKLNSVHRIIFEKLVAANQAKEQIIQLKESDFNEFSQNWDDLPDTLASMVELVKEGGQTKIQISGCGGSSAANILGRFCHKESPITPFTKNIIAKEKELEPNKIIAEIVHLPEARVGNILMRPNFREYEIPYLAQSILPSNKKLPLEDLYISIKNSRIYLRSKKHNKEVLPHLTNAHNYSANALPIYHFLSDLQTQGLRGGVGFNFGPLESMFDFLPRVAYGNLILHEAKWRILKDNIKKLMPLKNEKEKLMKSLKQFQRHKGIPQYVLLAAVSYTHLTLPTILLV